MKKLLCTFYSPGLCGLVIRKAINCNEIEKMTCYKFDFKSSIYDSIFQ